MILPTFVIIPILILVYTGPYIFIYGRTMTWTFPKIDMQDTKAFDNLESSVGQTAKLTKIEDTGGAREANYSLTAGLLHRKFLDWVGFPLVLDINDFRFKALGIYNNKIIFECNHLESAFPKPTGNEPWYIYQPLVDRNDNTTLNVSCYGDASVVDQTSLPASITMNWFMSAHLVGDRNEKDRNWTSSQPIEIIDARPSISPAAEKGRSDAERVI